MAYRQFNDPEGVEWTVYDVVPRAEERRANDRRDPGHPMEDGQLDRRGEDRRAPIVSTHAVRITRGWLCFESANERRRLQPVPEGWHTMSDAALSEILQQARVAPRRTGPGRETPASRP